ncbi:membrane associated rhomboid family serine protease [Lacinutrix venerupis]|uniref:rhomboid family intramembrane serine protease n=1 Tax=Lacinutrix venerupis TaxID=1486034 RepID=UPI000EAD6634|nr:rhomboid family intramembrane serine protease [Lacinutrix venerupis]RLJ64438.1 membrane associated rhomboid family serine protease [Lacinutrix venerupis]
MSNLDQLKYKFKNLNVLEKIIAINVIIFLIVIVLKPVISGVLSYLELPPSFNEAILQPWSIITYSFLHYKLLHLVFNMIWLYFIGRLFLNLFSAKMALNLYFLGSIAGALMFLLCYNIFPEYFANKYFPLIGASAAVRAIFIFLCAYMPNTEVRLITWNVKIWYIGAVLILFDFIGLSGANAGGSLAHLGGALLGFVYAKQLVKGNDIGKGFERLLDSITNWFKTNKKGNLKTVYKDKTKVGGYTKGEFSEFNNQKKIDIILDKISKSGYESLTAAEKEFLFKAGK